MAKKVTATEVETKEVSKKDTLIAFLKAKTPTLFDRHPEITGNIDTFADEIISIFE